MSPPGRALGLPHRALFMKLQYSGEAAKSLVTGMRPNAMSRRSPATFSSP